MINEFREYWSKTKGMLDFKAQSMSSENKRVPIKNIVDYYKKEIIDKLWFSEHFPSKYNDWVEINLPPSNPKRLKVRNAMLGMSVSPLAKKRTVFGAIIVAVLLLLLSVVLIKMKVVWYVYTLIIALALCLVVWGLYAYKYLIGYCSIKSIESEMNRIEDEVVQLLN
ncbi:MAG: hypothetical protein IJZ31_07335 [Bacteroidaceae bacterium]|nr:hypothetical protein [Bacteroidaceae bacterium]